MALEILWQGIEEDMGGCVGGGTQNRTYRYGMENGDIPYI